MEFGSAASDHMQANLSGTIVNFGSSTYTISRSAGSHMRAQSLGAIENAGNTVTLTGTPAFSDAFAVADNGVVSASGNTWSGSATGKRYSARNIGRISSGGAGETYFPGNAAGERLRGGVYDDLGPVSSPAYFNANLSAAQTMTTGTGPNLVNFNTENSDNYGWYDNATNYRFTPLVAGKYRIHVQLECSATSVTGLAAYIYKNGSLYARSLNLVTAAGFLGVSVDAILDMNGTTDYVDGRAIVFGTGTCTINGGAAPIISWIEGVYVSP